MSLYFIYREMPLIQMLQRISDKFSEHVRGMGYRDSCVIFDHFNECRTNAETNKRKINNIFTQFLNTKENGKTRYSELFVLTLDQNACTCIAINVKLFLYGSGAGTQGDVNFKTT